MINKQLAILVVFILINSAICTQFYNNGDDNGESSDDRILRGQYNFNHPPSVEYYNPIPVAVVYEDETPKGKSFHLTRKEFLKDLTGTTTTNEDYLENPGSTLDPYKIRSAAGQSIGKHIEKLKVKPKQLVLNDSEIPVSVVYEADGVTESRKRVKYSADDRTTKTIQPRRRQQQPTEIDTLETQTESDQVQIASKPRKRTRERDPVVPILESENYVFAHRGNFHYSYEGGDGTKAYSSGELRRNEGDEAGEAVVGGFSYKDKDGNDVSLSYTADENGYRPVGAHLPTPPPIPPAIARALQYLATATSEPVTEDFRNN